MRSLIARDSQEKRKDSLISMTSNSQILQIESWPIERLVPYARNARTHSAAQIAQIAASITEFGFNNPVLIDPQGGIIAGHGRVLALSQLAYIHVPVIVLGHLSPNQKRAFMLADNQLGLNAGWDEQKLRLELEALAADKFDLSLMGFEAEELLRLLAQQEQPGLTDPDEAPALEKQAITLAGDLWQLGQHRLLCADATKPESLRRVLDGAQCDLLFTDLPYNVDYTGKGHGKMKIVNDNLGAEFGKFLQAACHSMLSVSAGPIYLCMSSSELHRLQAAFQNAGGHWSTYIIWAKNYNRASHAPWRCHLVTKVVKLHSFKVGLKGVEDVRQVGAVGNLHRALGGLCEAQANSGGHATSVTSHDCRTVRFRTRSFGNQSCAIRSERDAIGK